MPHQYRKCLQFLLISRDLRNVVNIAFFIIYYNFKQIINLILKSTFIKVKFVYLSLHLHKVGRAQPGVDYHWFGFIIFFNQSLWISCLYFLSSLQSTSLFRWMGLVLSQCHFWISGIRPSYSIIVNHKWNLIKSKLFIFGGELGLCSVTAWHNST